MRRRGQSSRQPDYRGASGGAPVERACFGPEDSDAVDALMAVASDYSTGHATLEDPRIGAIARDGR